MLLTYVDEPYLLCFRDEVESHIDILHPLCVDSGLLVISTKLLSGEELEQVYEIDSVREAFS